MEYAIIVLIGLGIGAGACGGCVIAMGLMIRTLGLKNRVDALEILAELTKGQLVAEIKRRAGAEGLNARSLKKEIEAMVQNLPAQNNPNWSDFERQYFTADRPNGGNG